jgi:hypothetical protein
VQELCDGQFTRADISALHVFGKASRVSLVLYSNSELMAWYNYCYGSVKNGFNSAILTKIPRMKKEERAGSATDD